MVLKDIISIKKEYKQPELLKLGALKTETLGVNSYNCDKKTQTNTQDNSGSSTTPC